MNNIDPYIVPRAIYDTCKDHKITPKALAAYEACKGVHRLQWNSRVADLQLDEIDRLMAELLLENRKGMTLVPSGPPTDQRVIAYSEYILREGKFEVVKKLPKACFFGLIGKT